MPTLEKFTLKNFKGIKETEILIADKGGCPVITLIGLNESGKTTILEGLSHFVSGDRSVSALFGTPLLRNTVSLIPLHKKAAFSSTIEITATVRLVPADIIYLQDQAKALGMQLDGQPFLNSFIVQKEYAFEDSIPKTAINRYSFTLMTRPIKKGKQPAFKKLGPPESGADPNFWTFVANYIERKLPQISYFPTFLVDMPSRIYLKEFEHEGAINRHYRTVFQDILASLEENLSLEKHVSDRIEHFRKNRKTEAWISPFLGSPEKATIDSVFQKITNAVTREVLGSWKNMFQRGTSAKNIFVEWGIDTEKNNLPYASFHVSDGDSKYALSERSLGFRWFFSFLLFTAFRQGNTRPTIFVFDEPAANLHAKAQAELLKSFSRIASGGNKIIYSTHSHHMINPQWLSGAYIIENTAIDHEKNDDFELTTRPTNIVATKYREFLNNFPSRSSYFQPVIEKLEYTPPEVLGTPPFVIVEGISDYYALRLAKRISKKEYSFCIIPGVGSGAPGLLINQMLGRGEKFVLLLDDDKAGKKEAQRYQTEWFIDKDQTITLGDISKNFSNMRLEQLLGDEAIALIQSSTGLSSEPTKKQIGWYLAEACAKSETFDALPLETQNRLEIVLDGVQARLSGNAET